MTIHIPPRQTSIVLATRNAHKTEEIRAILGDRFLYLTLTDLPNAPAVKEDAATFGGNATEKAVHVAQWLAGEGSGFRVPGVESRVQDSRVFVLADDSGLEVDALNGAPGVHSARFAALDGPANDSPGNANSPDAANNAKLLRLLQDVPLEKRTARFRCVLALVEVCSPSAARTTELFDGICEGRISFAPTGQRGFGYDPLFVPAGYEQSFGELGSDVKNKISHRASALVKLRQRLQEFAL